MVKKRHKRASAQKKSGKKLIKKSNQEQANDKEKPFDFGGIPERDLKKNLGCG